MKAGKFQNAVNIILIIAALFYSPSTLADKGGNGHGKDKEKHESKHGHKKGKDKHHKHDKHDDDDRHAHDRHYHRDDRHSHGHIVIDNSDRILIKQYIVENYGSHCPPGLAKKHNGCLPPGQAKKHYIIGQPLPEVVVWQPVPQPLIARLQPVPVGYQYVMVDKDVLLISEASHKVIDAITLLSAVGK